MLKEEVDVERAQVSRDRKGLDDKKVEFQKTKDNFEMDRAHLLKEMHLQRTKTHKEMKKLNEFKRQLDGQRSLLRKKTLDFEKAKTEHAVEARNLEEERRRFEDEKASVEALKADIELQKEEIEQEKKQLLILKQ